MKKKNDEVDVFAAWANNYKNITVAEKIYDKVWSDYFPILKRIVDEKIDQSNLIKGRTGSTREFKCNKYWGIGGNYCKRLRLSNKTDPFRHSGVDIGVYLWEDGGYGYSVGCYFNQCRPINNSTELIMHEIRKKYKTVKHEWLLKNRYHNFYLIIEPKDDFNIEGFKKLTGQTLSFFKTCDQIVAKHYKTE